MLALWQNYDHLSDYCFSSILNYENSERNKFNLRKTTKNEWKKRKELLKKILNQIFSDKPDESLEGDSSLPREIDIDKTYTELEDSQNAMERGKMGPDALSLAEFDVNLRRNKVCLSRKFKVCWRKDLKKKNNFQLHSLKINFIGF